MATQLTPADARQSLNAHVAAKGAEIRLKFGPQIGWDQLQRICEDRSCVRYPCEIVFDESNLGPGELAHPDPKGARPEDGFSMAIRPAFRTDLEGAVGPILYQLVLVNYGAFASPEDAEAFGAAVLGIEEEEFYQSLCRLADKVAPLRADLAPTP